MKSERLSFAIATLIASLAVTIPLAAQHTRYKLIDIATLGGPSSYFSGFGQGEQLLNNAGIVAGSPDTSTPDPNAPNCSNPDCFVSHAFRWQNGVLTDVGTLQGVNGDLISVANSVNARGWIAGSWDTGGIDPLTGFPATHAVLWRDAEITDLGTLGTGIESNAAYVNNGGQVVGLSTINTVPDPFSFLGAATHTFIWKNGVKRDLGTLGGPDSFPSVGCTNEHEGLVAGQSFTNSTPNATTGMPTQDPFLWENGIMTVPCRFVTKGGDREIRKIDVDRLHSCPTRGDGADDSPGRAAHPVPAHRVGHFGRA